MEHGDKALPEVWIELFGEKKKLAPTFGTFCRFQQKTGKNPFDMLLWVSPTPIDMVTLIWAALGGESCGKSVDEVADAMSGEHIADFKELVDAMFKKGELPEDVAKNDEAA